MQVGGGLIVISTGWALLKQRDDEDDKDVKRDIQPRDPLRHAFYPLTLPLTVGPGSISIAITLGANAPYHEGFHVLAILAAVIGSAVLAASIFTLLRLCQPPRPRPRSYRDNRDRAAHLVLAGLHRSAYLLERRQRSADLRTLPRPLSRAEPAAEKSPPLRQRSGQVLSQRTRRGRGTRLRLTLILMEDIDGGWRKRCQARMPPGFGAHLRSNFSNSSGARAGLNKNPCASSQPCSRSISNCSIVCTPSAITLSFRLRARPMMAVTMLPALHLLSRPTRTTGRS